MDTVVKEIDSLQEVRIDKHGAFDTAFNSFWEPIYRKAYSKVQSSDLAKDLTQEVFIVFWQNFDNLKPENQVLPYLYSILRNKILQHFEKDEVRLRYALKVSQMVTPNTPSSHHLLIGKELSAIIKEEVEKMPARMKQIYILKKDQYYTNKAIAEELSLSEQTVKNQLQNAYQRLKVRIKAYDPSLMTWIISLFISSLKS